MRTGFLLSLPILVSALPVHKDVAQPVRRKAITVPVKQWKRPGANLGLARRQEFNAPTVGLGDLGDLIYAVDVNVGGTDVTVHMDTGSSDLWVITDACTSGTCPNAKGTALAASTGTSTGAQAVLNFGDSRTGTQASGPVNKADTTIAGLTLPDHPFAAVDFTNSSIVGPGVPTSGILGLSFPTASQVQTAAAIKELGSSFSIDNFVKSTASLGPLLTRMALSGQLEQPMFTITLQRDTVDVGGQPGGLTLGDLPDGVDNSTLTWVPVRLYAPEDGGLPADPSAPGEIFPLRWEVVIDNVYFDGQQLPQPANTIGGKVSALVDTGNSLLRGPQDLVSNIFDAITPGSGTSSPSYPCSDAHTLEFEIGGQRFPIDPRDFVGTQTGEAQTCDASRLVVTDPPSTNGQLFSWSLGDPFMKSNLVAFYFGNLSHPSVDPPRIGFLSTVPKDANTLLQQAVDDAEANGGVFQSTSNVAATGTIAVSASSAQVAPTGTDSTAPTGTDSVTPTGAGSTAATGSGSAIPTGTDSAVSTGLSGVGSAAPTGTASPTGTSLAPGGASSAAAGSGSPSPSAPGAAPTTNSAAAPVNSVTANGGVTTSTNVAVVTSSSSSTSSAASASQSSGALSAARAPAAWAVAFGALAMVLFSM